MMAVNQKEKKGNEISFPDESRQKSQNAQLEEKGSMNLLAEMTTLAWNLVIPIVGGVLLGHYLDQRSGEGITWTLSLLVLGVIIALSNLYNLYIEHGQQRETQGIKKSTDKERNEKEP